MSTHLMSRRTLISGLAASLSIGHAAAHGLGPGGSDWGALELLDAEDRVVPMMESGQRWTLLQLWAHWCPVCLAELEPLHTAAAALAPRGVAVVLVSSPQDWPEDGRVADARAPGLRRARPSGRTTAATLHATLFNADGWYYVPRSILYDHERGAVVWSHRGRVDWHAEPWRAQAGAVS